MNIRLGPRPARGERNNSPTADALTDAVDRMLQSLSRQGRPTKQEAVLALEEVLLAAEPSALGPRVLEILDPALSLIARQAIVERSVLVDALLDVRLALRH
jgi:hypothetical protein